jgi:hypothetical protein
MSPMPTPLKPILPAALCALALACLAACTRSDEPNAEVLTAAMNSYLAQRGDLCLAKNTWPIDVTQHEIDSGARNALQMPVLERLGLVASTVAEVDVDDAGTKHHMKVRRFVLTDAGRKYYVVRAAPNSAGANAAAPKGDFCAAKLSLDRIVKWDVRKPSDGTPRQAVVTYTYRIDAAPWTHDAEAQKVFPVVASVVRGAGTAQLEETFSQTDAGWVSVDLQGS